MSLLQEKTGIFGQDLEADIIVSMHNGPPDYHVFYGDPLNPPVISLDWHGELRHVSTTKGFGSSAAKYKLAAEDIAKQVFQALSKGLKERREKEGVMPEAPAVFYPSYRPPPALPLAEFGKLETVASWHGLMNHNETLWRLEPTGRPADALGEMRHRLESTGWKGADAGLSLRFPTCT